jgi:hypothetical protein
VCWRFCCCWAPCPRNWEPVRPGALAAARSAPAPAARPAVLTRQVLDSGSNGGDATRNAPAPSIRVPTVWVPASLPYPSYSSRSGFIWTGSRPVSAPLRCSPSRAGLLRSHSSLSSFELIVSCHSRPSAPLLVRPDCCFAKAHLRVPSSALRAR